MKPDYEMFFDQKYKAYCGKCGRIMLIGPITDANVKQAEEKIKECPHCGEKVDWRDEE